MAESVQTALVPYDQARKALAECKRVDEVKKIKDQADAMRFYATRAKDRQLLMDAVEISAMAERRLGELIAEEQKRGKLDRGKGGDRRSRSKNTTVKTLADLGIDKHLSSDAQRLAGYSESEFKEVITQWRQDAAATDRNRITINMLAYARTIFPTKGDKNVAGAADTDADKTKAENAVTNETDHRGVGARPLVLASIEIERSRLHTITKTQSNLIAARLDEITHLSDASGLISCHRRDESLAEIHSAAEENDKASYAKS